jgi:hypothetical protein
MDIEELNVFLGSGSREDDSSEERNASQAIPSSLTVHHPSTTGATSSYHN